ncbi:MAG TPA: BON domain-containing protein [Ktedonobacteraceae bacterium]
MDTSLQNTHIIDDQLVHPASPELEEEQLESEEESHIHLPGPSYWPIFLSVAILITIAGVFSITSFPWITLAGGVLVLIGILGWGLEDPMAGTHAKDVAGKSTLPAEVVLQNAEDVVDEIVTVSSTAWSAHPVKVFIDREEPEGVVLSLYGKVELEEQKREVEEALRNLPGVIDVMNFLVAEDELLNEVNALIERLKAAGKLEGAKNLSVLVENYIVSLYGDVPKPEMKYMLEKEITSIPGARVVINHIGLNEEIPGNLGRTMNRIARI